MTGRTTASDKLSCSSGPTEIADATMEDEDSFEALLSRVLHEAIATPSASVGDVVLPQIDFRLEQGLRITHLIGEGALGVVFAAEVLSMPDHPPVALKLLRESSQEFETLARICAVGEAQALIGLSHSRIVRLFAAGESQAHGAFIAMELVSGVNLADWMNHHGPLPSRAVAELALVLAEALTFTHARGLIHCDLKPSNILGCRPCAADGAREGCERLDLTGVKIGDFGLAIRLDPRATVQEQRPLGGTPGYMPPEQFGARTPHASMDVFGLGMTMLHALNGTSVLSRESQERLTREADAADTNDQSLAFESRYREQLSATITPTALNDLVSDRYLRAIVTRAVEIDPARRYPAIAEFAADLRCWLGDRRAIGSGHEYSLLDRWRLLLRRSRRKEPEFAVDQARIWGLFFLVLAPCASLLSAWSTCLRLQGVPYTEAAFRTSLPFQLLAFSAGAFLFWLTRGGRVVRDVFIFILTLALAMVLCRNCLQLHQSHQLASVGIVIFGMAMVAIGLFARFWRVSIWLGFMLFALAAALGRSLESPEFRPFGDVVLGNCIALILGVLGVEYAAVRRFFVTEKP